MWEEGRALRRAFDKSHRTDVMIRCFASSFGAKAPVIVISRAILRAFAIGAHLLTPSYPPEAGRELQPKHPTRLLQAFSCFSLGQLASWHRCNGCVPNESIFDRLDRRMLRHPGQKIVRIYVCVCVYLSVGTRARTHNHLLYVGVYAAVCLIAIERSTNFGKAMFFHLRYISSRHGILEHERKPCCIC